MSVVSINVITELMKKYAKKRCLIKNSGNGKAYMMAMIIDKNYCVL